jgi:hypothetical protein
LLKLNVLQSTKFEGWDINEELMLKVVVHFFDDEVLSALVLRSISKKPLVLGFPDGLNAASNTCIVSFAVLLSKSIAPPLPAWPVKNPDKVASLPKNMGSTCVKPVCGSPE